MGKYFSMKELCRSNTATLNGIKNIPNKEEKKNLELLISMLDEVREILGRPIRINSGFRSNELNSFIGGVSNSDHTKGMAADLDCYDNAKLFRIIRDNVKFRQLIWEFGNDNQPNWVHVAYNINDNKCQVLRSKKVDGRTKYVNM